MKRLIAGLCGWLVLGGLVGGCEDKDPETTGTGGAGGHAAGGGGAGGLGPACAADENVTPEDNAACMQDATDYTPGADDTWEACIADSGTYTPIDPNIGSVARIEAFEQIAKLLGLGEGKQPSSQDFLDARVQYSIDEGLESRVSRREDEHLPPAEKKCSDMTPDEIQMNADRCVGPAKIQPILNEAFQDGIDGKEPALSAARIEAALIWFLYLSVYKEAISCTDTPKDCDSSWAYYTGGETQDKGLGLARYTKARSPQAHDFIWNGTLAVRCWRDLDNPTGVAMNLDLRDKAAAQLDRALLRAVALFVRQRALALPCDTAWESVRIVGPVLDREATARDPAQAAILRDEIAKGPDGFDATAFVGALDAVFPCP